MGRARRNMGETKKIRKHLKTRDHLGDLEAEGIIILNIMLNK